jgi:hypothetical protein
MYKEKRGGSTKIAIEAQLSTTERRPAPDPLISVVIMTAGRYVAN